MCVLPLQWGIMLSYIEYVFP